MRSAFTREVWRVGLDSIIRSSISEAIAQKDVSANERNLPPRASDENSLDLITYLATLLKIVSQIVQNWN